MSRRSRLEADLHDYAAGDLDENACREIERRLQDDPDARALFDEVKAAHEALGMLRERPEPPVSADDALPNIRAAIAAPLFRDKPKLYLEGFGSRFYRRVALAATVLLAVTAGLFVYDRLSPRAQPAPPTVADDRKPTPEERGLEPFVDAGSLAGGVDAATWIEMLRKSKLDPRDLRVSPMHNVVPVGLNDVDRR